MTHETRCSQWVTTLLDHFLHSLVKPLSRINAVLGVEVTIMEGGVCSQLVLDFVDVDIFDNLLHSTLVLESSGEGSSSKELGRRDLDVLEFSDVKEMTSFLRAKVRKLRASLLPEIEVAHIDHLELFVLCNFDHFTWGDF
jgi:hypothetical protein